MNDIVFMYYIVYMWWFVFWCILYVDWNILCMLKYLYVFKIIIYMISIIYIVYIFVNIIFVINFLFICWFLLICIEIFFYYGIYVCFVRWYVIYYVCWNVINVLLDKNW